MTRIFVYSTRQLRKAQTSTKRNPCRRDHDLFNKNQRTLKFERGHKREWDAGVHEKSRKAWSQELYTWVFAKYCTLACKFLLLLIFVLNWSGNGPISKSHASFNNRSNAICKWSGSGPISQSRASFNNRSNAICELSWISQSHTSFNNRSNAICKWSWNGRISQSHASFNNRSNAICEWSWNGPISQSRASFHNRSNAICEWSWN